MDEHILNFKKYISDLLPMKDEVFHLAIDYLVVEKVKKGAFLLEAESVCDSISFVSHGIFRIFQLKDGVELNSCFCAENSIASSFESFANETPSKEYAQALEDSVIVSLSKKNLMKLYEMHPKWQDLGRTLTEKECIRLTRRVGSLSFETAKTKYEQLLQSQPDVILRVPVQDLASYLGVSRETLSRIRSQMVQ